MACCNCTTTWTCEETDLVFKVYYNFEIYSPSSPGADWAWTYTVGTPPDSKIISVATGAKSEMTSGPNSSCNCTDNSSGTVVSEDPTGEEERLMGIFNPTYQGFWRRGNQTIYGQARWRAVRSSVRKKKNVDYTNSHKCGDGCTGGTGNWNWDDIESIEGAWETWEPY